MRCIHRYNRHIECGLAKPSFDLLIARGQALGVHPALLLSGNPLNADRSKEAAEHALLFDLYNQLTEHFHGTVVPL
ncbi:MAG: hypothetical protein IJ191_08550 [Treponema sp.]|nr:hypothetical protein [Treponema sp.]